MQGMIALKYIRDQYYTNLYYAEVAPSNVGVHRKYQGVSLCLFAVACKLSWDAGNEGYVLFRSYPFFMRYHMEILNAKSISWTTMYVDSYGSAALIDKYFKETNNMAAVEREESVIDQFNDLQKRTKNGKLTNTRKVGTYQWREVILLSKILGRNLSTYEMEKFKES